ncbi:MAG: protein kinase [Polyangiaceae bacterium]
MSEERDTAKDATEADAAPAKDATEADAAPAKDATEDTAPAEDATEADAAPRKDAGSSEAASPSVGTNGSATAAISDEIPDDAVAPGTSRVKTLVIPDSVPPAADSKPADSKPAKPVPATTADVPSAEAALSVPPPGGAPETCRACQTINATEAKFCSECGARLRLPESLTDPGPVPSKRDALAITVPGEISVAETGHVADPLIGVVIAGRYRIIEPLGRGGMGVVYRVEHARIGKLMALKLLTGELSRDNEVVARFKREALMVSKLSHPNTVQVFDFGTSEGMTYLAMEYLRGEDLGRLVRREGALPTSRAARIVTQVCSSLSEAHRLDIIHRDLKPENVFILKSDTGADLVKVLDFGLAKLRESTELSEVTSRGAIVGTPFYMSPEQIRGEAADQRSDVYALGALTYVCLTGHPPFDAPRPMGVLTKHLVEKPQNPAARFPELGIPPGVAAIVMKALEKEPTARFQSVEELQHALVTELKQQGQSSAELMLDSGQMHALARADSDAVTRGEVERYERKLRRRGFLAWASVVVTGAVILGGAWHLYERAKMKPSFAGTEVEPNNVPGEATPVPFGEKVRGQLGRRLDESRSDRDFYRVDVPEDVGHVHLSLSSLPNMATCALMYRVGLDSPLGTYCPGAPGGSLDIPSLELKGGSYYFAVMQDRDGYGMTPPLVQENVSDAYTLEVSPASSDESHESEPNDSVRDANVLSRGVSFRGRLAWMRDVDVLCLRGDSGSVRFEVEDTSSRPAEAVLQITPRGGPSDGVPVRVHTKAPSTNTGSDVASPWQSAVTAAKQDGSTCLELTLVPNPLHPPPQPRVAPASPQEYTVHVRIP